MTRDRDASRSRREVLKALAAVGSLSAMPDSIQKALAVPAHRRTGTIKDVEHIIILTQENRSFDHYFGTLRGVRGFGDRRAMKLASGKTVWHQPNGAGEVLPYRPPVPHLGASYLPDRRTAGTTAMRPSTRAASTAGSRPRASSR